MIEIKANTTIVTAAIFQPASPAIFLHRITKNGANNAPTAKMLCNKFNAAGLLLDTSFTTALLKLEILPRLSPVTVSYTHLTLPTIA